MRDSDGRQQSENPVGKSCWFPASFVCLSLSVVVEVLVLPFCRNANYECSSCPLKFTKRRLLSRHMETKHRDEYLRGKNMANALTSADRPFKCLSCNRRFLCENDLQVHELKKHSNDSTEKMHPCPHCPKRFSKPSLLTVSRNAVGVDVDIDLAESGCVFLQGIHT